LKKVARRQVSEQAKSRTAPPTASRNRQHAGQCLALTVPEGAAATSADTSIAGGAVLVAFFRGASNPFLLGY
jgi:hypothetical protein